MIILGRISSGQLIKILGIVQVLIAIVVTSLGIAITVKFAHVHHEKDTPYEHAKDYKDNPWTTKYGAGIFMGLVLLVAGLFGASADVKPEKSKYTIAAIILNVVVVVLSIVVIVFSIDAISWYENCQFYLINNKGKLEIQTCSSKDKSTGKELYLALLITLIIILPVTILHVTLSVLKNKGIFEDCCGGGCFRKLVYKAKGGGNTTISYKTKNTHEFDQVSIGPQPFSPSTNLYV